MITKTALFMAALVPLAAATVFSASATPARATHTQLEVRGDVPPPPSPSPSGGNWGNKTDCVCAWDKDHVPKIAEPCKDTVWRAGERRKVVWEKKGDDWKHNEPGGHDGTDGKGWDGSEGKGDSDDKEAKDWGHGKDGKKHGPCKTRLFLRKGEARPFVILAEDFDVKAGFVEVTVPNVFHGEDYRVALLARDDKPELESCSATFRIAKDEKHGNRHCKEDCKDGRDGKECCKDKNGEDDKDGTDGTDGKDSNECCNDKDDKDGGN